MLFSKETQQKGIYLMHSHNNLKDSNKSIAFFNTSPTNKTKDCAQIWQEDPLVSYQNFLQYAGKDVRQSVLHKQDVKKWLSTMHHSNKQPADFNDLKVCVYNGRFYPLSTALDGCNYCSKFTIRNIKNANLNFTFQNDIPFKRISINADYTLAKKCNIAYRNIVPNDFAEDKLSAGPMGYHEYIIDGENHNGTGNDTIIFLINSNFANTPIKIVLENCTGKATVTGLNEEEISKRFDNKCDNNDLFFTNTTGPNASLRKS